MKKKDTKWMVVLLVVVILLLGVACYLHWDCRNLEALLAENPAAGGAGMSQTVDSGKARAAPEHLPDQGNPGNGAGDFVSTCYIQHDNLAGEWW